MTQAQWARLKQVFEGALEQPAHARRTWVTEQCRDDPAVLHEALALLQTHETAGNFLETTAAVDPLDLESILPGTVIGSYKVLEEIGRGGMGVVYLAEDTRLGRRVALKSLPASVSMHSDLRQRLRREARAAATISHPAVAVVYALEEFGEHLFIASEYVPGETLRNEIARGPIAPDRARAIATDIAAALGAAHDAGVIHRDLKPENVLIRSDGGVKVVDFGIAQIEGPDATRLTRVGSLLGTPAYMAPEQLLGGHVDARADIYALGIVLSEMVNGRHPLRGRASTKTENVSGPFSTIINRCLHADPDQRYANARAMIDDLTSGTSSGSTAAPLADPLVATPYRFWWEFHQAVTALIYALAIVPAWYARELVEGWGGRAFFVTLVIAVVVAAIARLHLWFTSRFYPSELAWVHGRSSIWIRIADWIFAATLVVGGVLIRDHGSALSIVLPSIAVGAVVAFLLIEPVTTRDAFKKSGLEK